ncbi:15560_t:CDS:2 [Acaulospora colombiana]|uniref:15560_t:CDS:1 n=1 Tax=Acaulospora colombiana TaxID=27376 RepID=A0ACA9JXP0_9GLOM|nr:15560_t:CDS:2 [Acaulospora colombiana]
MLGRIDLTDIGDESTPLALETNKKRQLNPTYNLWSPAPNSVPSTTLQLDDHMFVVGDITNVQASKTVIKEKSNVCKTDIFNEL